MITLYSTGREGESNHYEDVDRGSVAIHCSTAFALDVVIQGDCIGVMRSWPDGCVNVVITDPPYGITSNQWDNVPDLDLWWSEIWRVCRGPVVMTASQPFTSEVVMSQRDAFKHEWIWQKTEVAILPTRCGSQ